MIILGIDPGSARIGFGLIKKENGKLIHLKSGVLEISNRIGKNDRLAILSQKMEKLVNLNKPELVGIERVFFNKNRKTAIEVAEARGVIIATIAKKSIPIIEMGPKEIKLAVTGDGNASKKGVMKMVNLCLNINKTGLDDATDALAIAVCISNNKLINMRG